MCFSWNFIRDNIKFKGEPKMKSPTQPPICLYTSQCQWTKNCSFGVGNMSYERLSVEALKEVDREVAERLELILKFGIKQDET